MSKRTVSEDFFTELARIAPHRFDVATVRNLTALARMKPAIAQRHLKGASQRYQTTLSVVRHLPSEPGYRLQDRSRLWSASVQSGFTGVSDVQGASAPLMSRHKPKQLVGLIEDYFGAQAGGQNPPTTFGPQEVIDKIMQGIMEAFEDMGSELYEIRTLASGHSVSSWKEERILKAAALAAPSAIGGPAALAYLPLEIAALMRFAYNSVLGVGFIRNGTAWSDDFVNSFYVQADDDVDFDRELRTKLLAKLRAAGAVQGGTLITTQAGAQLVSSALVNLLALKVGKKLAPAALNQLATKLAAWLSGPSMAKLIPIVGAVVGATVNGWVTNNLIDGADRYYGFLRKVAADV